MSKGICKQENGKQKREKNGLSEKFKRIGRRLAAGFCLIAGIGLLAGCANGKDRTQKLDDLDFTVLSPDEFPQELTETLEQKKGNAFRLTYADDGYLYICVGYGMQETGGYSITVKELYETPNGIYLDTTLLGPAPGEEISTAPSYPFIVLKLEDIGKSVIFN